MTQTNSNKVNQLIFSGLNEIMGPGELTKIVTGGENEGGPAWRELPDQDLGKVQAAMASKFGAKELQGLLLRCGRASCKFFVREYGADMQVTSIEYRLLPSKKRLITGLEAAAGKCAQLFKKDIAVTDEGDAWLWRESKPCQKAAPSNGQEFYFTIGLLQEYMSWLSGGKAFSVRMAEAVDPSEAGYCLKINKQPIE